MDIIGKRSSLEVIKSVDFGYYLDGGPYGEILLPTREVVDEIRPGTETEVFIFCDSEDRLVATQHTPKAMVGDWAYLQVVAVSDFGAFLDWGLPKDLLVPFREQFERMEKGEFYLVKVLLDDATERIMASSRLSRHLKGANEDLEVNQEVDLIVARKTDLGYRVIVNEEYWGMVYENEIFKTINIGDRMKGFVKRIREDERIDISFQKQGAIQISDDAKILLEKIKAAGGFIPLTDKSAPEKIYSIMEMSKKAFKRAVGVLYKQRLITLEKEGIRLVD